MQRVKVYINYSCDLNIPAFMILSFLQFLEQEHSKSSSLSSWNYGQVNFVLYKQWIVGMYVGLLVLWLFLFVRL